MYDLTNNVTIVTDALQHTIDMRCLATIVKVSFIWHFGNGC